MKRYTIDTNALISFVTDRSLIQQEAVAPLFAAAARSQCTVICHQFVLTEFVFVMDRVYRAPKETISAIIRDFIALPGVLLQQETDFSTLLSLWPATIADFGDAIIATAGKANIGSEIVTFDEKFKSAARNIGLAVYLPEEYGG